MSAATPLHSSASSSAVPDTAGAEKALIERCRAGDLPAFDELVGVHQERVFNLCYWMLGNREDAADAAQEVFVRAYRSLGNFRGESAFGTWLHRIAVNASLDSLQRRKRLPLPYSDLDPQRDDADTEELTTRHAEPGEAQNSHGDPAQLSAQRERLRLVREALAALPEHYRLALVLFDIEGYSYEEVAQSLQLPLGTVKSRINRARRALRERLQGVRELFEV
jgi:RNA polymerase sigma-70 factor (ECF subfamily)